MWGGHMSWSIYIKLFTAWFKIGLFTFGGGYAMLPMIEREVIDVNHWTTREEIMDVFALAQSIPGAIAINSAIILGQRVGGIAGALFAAAGVVIPSIIIILLIAVYFISFQKNPSVMAVFSGIRAAVVGLVAAAAYRITVSNCRNKAAFILIIASFCISEFTNIHVAWIIIAGAIAGILIYYYLPQKFKAEDTR